VKQTQLRDQTSIRVVTDDEKPLVPGGVISSEQSELPRNCYVVPMVVLDKPIPIKRRKKARR
jgi:hypothetical protein